MSNMISRDIKRSIAIRYPALRHTRWSALEAGGFQATLIARATASLQISTEHMTPAKLQTDLCWRREMLDMLDSEAEVRQIWHVFASEFLGRIHWTLAVLHTKVSSNVSRSSSPCRYLLSSFWCFLIFLLYVFTAMLVKSRESVRPWRVFPTWAARWPRWPAALAPPAPTSVALSEAARLRRKFTGVQAVTEIRDAKKWSFFLTFSLTFSFLQFSSYF